MTIKQRWYKNKREKRKEERTNKAQWSKITIVRATKTKARDWLKEKRHAQSRAGTIKNSSGEGEGS